MGSKGDAINAELERFKAEDSGRASAVRSMFRACPAVREAVERAGGDVGGFMLRGSQWSPDEDDIIVEMYKPWHTTADVQKRMPWRTVGAINMRRSKLRKMGRI